MEHLQSLIDFAGENGSVCIRKVEDLYRCCVTKEHETVIELQSRNLDAAVFMAHAYCRLKS